MNYIIRAAMGDETNEGWIWIALPSRTVVRIKCVRWSVFCQVRDIQDNNFLSNYADSQERIAVSNPDETIVMSKWYRDALGGFETTAQDIALGRVVRRGEHGVKVATFAECRKENKETGEKEAFRRPWRTTVFHISQTEPLAGSGVRP